MVKEGLGGHLRPGGEGAGGAPPHRQASGEGVAELPLVDGVDHLLDALPGADLLLPTRWATKKSPFSNRCLACGTSSDSLALSSSWKIGIRRVGRIGGVVDVGEDRLALDHLEEVFLAEAGLEHGPVLRRVQRLPRRLRHGVQRLAEAHHVGRHHQLQDLHRLGALPRRDQAQRVNVLVVLLGALDVGRHRVGEVLQLRAVGRHGDLGSLEPVVQAGVLPAAEVRRQSVIVVVADQLRELGEDELPDGGDGDAEIVHGDTNGGPLEVSPVERDIAGHVDQGVIVDRVDFPLDCVGRHPDDLDLGPQPLGGRPEGIPVLLRLRQRLLLVPHLRLPHVVAAVEEELHDRRRLDLTRVVLQLVGQWVGEFGLPLHGLAEEGRQHHRQERQHVGIEADGGGHRRADSRPINQREPLLCLEFEGAQDPHALEGLRGCELLAFEGDGPGVVPAGEQACNVGEGDQIAGGGDGSPEGEFGDDVLVHELGHRLQDLPADA
ncbi:unnamed protein product [Spirodela intermedia]|uniref:Uncharacterized protein n=1 Tax=Spirodela intermedia TaxID=51605 RepID=A0A7I8KWD9_SPIIN|nr:unnamed protein product [Spirodela intermedia]